VTIDRLDLPTEDALVAYLSRMAELKVAEEGRHQHTRKADVRRDVSLADLPDPPARGATPSAEAIAADGWEVLIANLSQQEQEMVRMLRDGHTHQAVADQFGLTTKTIQRLAVRLRGQAGGPS
jgi:DNA-binding NarL/FixJ family response regulator